MILSVPFVTGPLCPYTILSIPFCPRTLLGLCRKRLYIGSRMLSSLWVSRTGSASDWYALQEALYKCIDTIQYINECIQYSTKFCFIRACVIYLLVCLGWLKQ